MKRYVVPAVLASVGIAYAAISAIAAPADARAPAAIAAASAPGAAAQATTAHGGPTRAAAVAANPASATDAANASATDAAYAAPTPDAAALRTAQLDRPLASPADASIAAPASPGATTNAVRVLVAPAQEATLFSQGIGRIRDVDGSLGSRFKAGTTLLSFDCDEQAARLKMAQAELSAARETHNAKLRLQGLQSAGELEVSLAAAAAQKAEAQVALYRAQQAYCVVKAPFDGRVVKLHVKAYEGVNQNAPLLDIISDGPLKLRLNAPSSWLRWLKVGTPFQVHIDETDKTYTARVTALNARVDAVSQSVELEGVIADNAPDLLPGMSGSARFAPGP
ncbi:efflux RND transporter periplasmic adaptor subunit [Bordetella flabilis]|uniref:efflux RND transporter periplasmic adaptor subunit n=1 Tax=Bordetella flabilis TaxID=463014 RepID=UPI000A036E91|nr:efflux RND transporter periplasmic adaptor subunit [Bordetella flabilis]